MASIAGRHWLGRFFGTAVPEEKRSSLKSDSKRPLSRYEEPRRPLSKLENLPNEVLKSIVEYLPPISRKAFSMTCHEFYRSFSTDYDSLDRCAKYAVLCYMITDGVIKEDKMYACALCKLTHSKTKFYPEWNKGASGELGRGMLGRPPAERFCELHYPSLVTAANDPLHNRWTMKEQTMCMHCGYLRHDPRCQCTCEVCGTSQVRTYNRLYTGPDKAIMYTMCRDSDATLFVTEGRQKDSLRISRILTRS